MADPHPYNRAMILKIVSGFPVNSFLSSFCPLVRIRGSARHSKIKNRKCIRSRSFHLLLRSSTLFSFGGEGCAPDFFFPNAAMPHRFLSRRLLVT